MTHNSFFIRHMVEAEIDLAVEWAAQEGWNPGINDAHCFWAADQQGFLVGIKDGQPIGCISAVRYGADYGFIGFYIVQPAWRGKGYGLQLWQSATEQLFGRITGLDGVTAQQENYQKSGFQFAYNNIRYCGTFTASSECIAEFQSDIKIIEANKISMANIVAFDRMHFFTERSAFLVNWLSQPKATALVAVNNDKILGYGVIRQCRQGWKIGPLFALDELVAEKMLLSLAATVKGQEFFLDVPQINVAAMSLVDKYQLTEVFATARMYNGRAPVLLLGEVFGVTTFELG